MILEGLWRAWDRFKRRLAAGYQRLVELDREWTQGSKLVVFVGGLAFVVILAVGWMSVVLIRKVPYVGVVILVVIIAVVVLSLRDVRADAASMDMSDWDDRPPVE